MDWLLYDSLPDGLEASRPALDNSRDLPFSFPKRFSDSQRILVFALLVDVVNHNPIVLAWHCRPLQKATDQAFLNSFGNGFDRKSSLLNYEGCVGRLLEACWHHSVLCVVLPYLHMNIFEDRVHHGLLREGHVRLEVRERTR